jgi:hypothetical protein
MCVSVSVSVCVSEREHTTHLALVGEELEDFGLGHEGCAGDEGLRGLQRLAVHPQVEVHWHKLCTGLLVPLVCSVLQVLAPLVYVLRE